MNKYDHFGVMLDCSRNAVMKPSELMKFIDLLEKMGYNSLEIYAEDTFKIEGEPYFGYMRGGYTADEIKAVDAYASAHGVELIPCIQTLAHFTNPIKLPEYRKIVDTEDILLIDEPRTYQLIDNIFKTLAKNFTSRNVNIGMDEADMVGLGKYLQKHGLQNRFELLTRHLKKVTDIAASYGFTVHMWSDMFFRLCNDGEYTYKNRVPKEVRDGVPSNVELTYWDYYQVDKSHYDKMLAAHKDFNNKTWFAGGVWTWRGFAPVNSFALRAMRPAMESVIENGIKDVFMTMWGDNGKECSFYAVLPALYTVRQYANGNFDEKKIKEGFKKTLGYDYDTFMLLDKPDALARNKVEGEPDNPSRTVVYSDCFMGQMDNAVANAPKTNYTRIAKELKDAALTVGEYDYIFNTLSSLCSLLEVKKDLGIRTRKLYKAGDKEGLRALTKRYDLCLRRLKVFYRNFRNLWFKENKAFGWEVHDVRLGGLMQRIQSCKERLLEYADGKTDHIDELDEELLDFGNGFFRAGYKNIVTYCDL